MISREPGRQNPSPGVHINVLGGTWVFLTVTTEHRTPWLANSTVQRLLEETWRGANAWLVADYLLMPDHLHCFCAPYDAALSIENWIAYWKSQFRKKHGNPVWRFQSRGWHHRLRGRESYEEKWFYVQQNPIRKGLIAQPEHWAFKGRVYDLSFR